MYAVNQVPAIDMSKSTTGCCAPLDVAKWDGKTFKFKDKPFIKVETRNFMHVPLNMKSAITKAYNLAEEAGVNTYEFMLLSHDVSPWKSEHFYAVSHDAPDLQVERLSGTYVAKVYEGKYSQARNWYKQVRDYVSAQGKQPLKTYFYYTTCPKCAKEYGKNYVVGFQEVA